jgi:hypothetical protein
MMIQRRFPILALAGALLFTACEDGTDPAETPLNSPTNVEARPVSPTALQVTWDEVSGATSYDVEMAEGTGSFAAAGTSNAGSFDATDLTTGSQYRFRITAVAGNRRSVASNPSALVTVPDEIFSILTADITEQPHVPRGHHVRAVRLHQGGEQFHADDPAGHEDRG